MPSWFWNKRLKYKTSVFAILKFPSKVTKIVGANPLSSSLFLPFSDKNPLGKINSRYIVFFAIQLWYICLCFWKVSTLSKWVKKWVFCVPFMPYKTMCCRCYKFDWLKKFVTRRNIGPRTVYVCPSVHNLYQTTGRNYGQIVTNCCMEIGLGPE